MPVVPLRVGLFDPSLDPSAAMWGDCAGHWLPPSLAWLSILTATGVPYSVVREGDAIADVGVLVFPEAGEWTGRGDVPVVTGPPPAGGPVEALQRLTEAMGALVRPDLTGVLVPRLDDPGSAARRYLEHWRHDDVPKAAWEALWAALRGYGAASVFCCPGWVEPDGRVVSSRQASPDEWSSLDEGARQGVAELECHGYTHLHPDTRRWAAAEDRYSNVGWYREFAPPVDDAEPDVAEQTAIMRAWQEACGPGTALVAPGEAWGANTIQAARACGFELMSSWGLCRLQLDVPTWTHLVESPYLDEPAGDAFAAGVPVVGYWHDRDMAVYGPEWAPRWLEAWRDGGATRAWSFSRLARAYASPIDAALVNGEVVVRAAPADGVLIDR
jgi:hypothetical protein